MSRRRISLTWVVALLSAGIVGGFMVVHDAYTGAWGAGGRPFQRLLSHGWHVLVYFVVIFVFMNAVLHKLLVRPVHDLYLKLYALTKGNRQRIEIDSPVSEVQEIADGINLLLSRPERIVDKTLAGNLRHESQVLRQIAHQLDERAPGSRVALLKSAARMERLGDALPPEAT